jgi:hypothetical protein
VALLRSLELLLNVVQQSGRPKPKHFGLQVFIAQSEFHHGHPSDGIANGTHPAGGFQPNLGMMVAWSKVRRTALSVIRTYLFARLPFELLYGTNHHQPDWQRCIDSLLPRRRFDEVGAGHHCDHGCFVDLKWKKIYYLKVPDVP